MALHEGKMATGELAQPAGHSPESPLQEESPTQRDNGGDGEEQVDDDQLSVTGQLRRAAGIAFPKDDSNPN
jgi:hypothetical protein